MGAARRQLLTGSHLSKRTPWLHRILGHLPDPPAGGVGGGGGGREGGGRQGGGGGGGRGGGASWEKGTAALAIGTVPGAVTKLGCTVSKREQGASGQLGTEELEGGGQTRSPDRL